MNDWRVILMIAALLGLVRASNELAVWAHDRRGK